MYAQPKSILIEKVDENEYMEKLIMEEIFIKGMLSHEITITESNNMYMCLSKIILNSSLYFEIMETGLNISHIGISTFIPFDIHSDTMTSFLK